MVIGKDNGYINQVVARYSKFSKSDLLKQIREIRIFVSPAPAVWAGVRDEFLISVKWLDIL